MEKTLAVINQMVAEGIIDAYAIGGAVGATFYLEPAATLDIDIFISFKQAGLLISLSPFYDYLKLRGYVEKDEHILIEGWPVQFLPAGNLLLEEALRSAIETLLGETPTRVMTAEHLAAIALQTGRSKDFFRIQRFIEEGAIEIDRFEEILKR